MTERRHSIPFLLTVWGTVLGLAAILLFFVVGCVAAPLDVYLGVPSAVTFAVLMGLPVLAAVIAGGRNALRLLPWGDRDTKTALALTLRYGVELRRHRRFCRDTDATPLARFSVRHTEPAETARHPRIGSGALAALLTDADEAIRTRASRHFRARVEQGGEPLWKLTEDVPAETVSELVAAMVDAEQQPKPDTVDYAWRLWLSQGDAGLWEALRQRRLLPGGPSNRLAQLALGLRDPIEDREAATDPAVPLRVRGRCAERCVETGTAPSDPVAAVTFFLLAGRADHYRRLDADGTLLLLANRGLHPAVRLQLRSVLTEIGELDLLRLLRRHRDDDPLADLAATTAPVSGHPRAWRALLDEPLLAAVEHAHRLDAWRPDDEEQRDLLHRLRSHDVAELTGLVARLDEVDDRPLAQPAILRDPTSVSVSPDGTRLVLSFAARPTLFREFDTATGELLRDWTGDEDTVVETAVYTRTGLVVSSRTRNQAAPMWTLDRYRIDATDHRFAVRKVLRHRSGTRHRFFRARGDGYLAASAADLQLWGSEDEPLATVDGLLGADIRLLSHEPTGDRVAVCADREIVIHDLAAATESSRHTPPHRPDAILLLDAENLVTARKIDGGRIELSRFNTADTEFTARTSHIATVRTRSLWTADGIVLRRFGSTGVVVSHRRQFSDFGFGVDARSMTDIPLDLSFAEHVIGGLTGGLDLLTRTTMTEGDRYRLRRLAPSPVGRMVEAPLSELSLADLELLDREQPLLPAAVRPLLELLRAFLRHRFATEIALGASGPMGTDYDIALGDDS